MSLGVKLLEANAGSGPKPRGLAAHRPGRRCGGLYPPASLWAYGGGYAGHAPHGPGRPDTARFSPRDRPGAARSAPAPTGKGRRQLPPAWGEENLKEERCGHGVGALHGRIFNMPVWGGVYTGDNVFRKSPIGNVWKRSGWCFTNPIHLPKVIRLFLEDVRTSPCHSRAFILQ